MDVSRIIKLNVGGVVYHTSEATIRSDCNSRLYTMLTNQTSSLSPLGPETEMKQEKEIFIDRDGTTFKYLLNYLRTGHLVIPNDETILNELFIEAQFYKINGVIDELSKPCYRIKGISQKMSSSELEAFSESLILDEEKRKNLVVWIGGETRKCSLLYRATRDGWSADVFHFLCDNKAPTLIVARKGSSVFGGYTEQSWSGNCSKTDKNAFLFSLVNPSGLGPVKIPLAEGEEEDAIFCHPSHGPVFGRGRDLVVSDQANRNNCNSRLDNSYKCPPNQVPTLFLAGTLTFTLSELEVYGIC